jgi:hypothetical protein
MSALPEVKVGQVWADNDKRQRKARTVTVIAVQKEFDGVPLSNPYAVVKSSTGRCTSVRLDRFRPTSTGYRLVQDVDGGEQS